MPKTLTTLLLALGLAATAHAESPPSPAGPTVPVERSHYAVLMDAASGKVLWGRGENVHRPMASTTKMMTALLLLERGHLTDTVIAPPGINLLPESSLHLSPGERISLHDLLYAMLLRSANDTAVAGADYLAGSVPAFVALMNQRAREIGAYDTHFVTPNGLPAPGHYSTAADLGRIAAYAAATQPLFDEIVRTPKYKVQRSVHIHDEWVRNTAATFLKTYPGADGIKTGYVHDAGHCFVGSATRGGWRLIAVALDSNSCREDVESLLNYGFLNFQTTPAVAQGTAVGTVTVPTAAMPVPVVAAQDIRVAVPKGRAAPGFEVKVVPLTPPPAAPILRGTKLGVVLVETDGKTEGHGDAVAAEDVPVQAAAALARTTRSVGRTLLGGLGPALGILLLLLLLATGRMIYGTAAKNARRRRSRLAAGLRGVDTAGPGAGKRRGRD